ncbi:hypothetical protein [Flavobacterium capsici]|uniref:Uncharacterized protein n=1 Tax=Flavobacterium capsici TaxID=3075618 RepID=A0AA96F0H2_9FLAO|nr:MULTISPECIES: hypothetical protein [unclassified Flavobacterium]WNM19274.1 hypothetical protein RN608_00995 [Flavobacterium sp. PMR2A8]WNM20663.1 hypothetical protein RN605_08165 [Flavobacterium sp. PMTSA4]
MEFETPKYDYVTVNVILEKNTLKSTRVLADIPGSRVVAMACVPTDNTEGRIIDLTVYQNNNDVVKAADIRFSQKTNGGTYQDSMRPVDLPGSFQYYVELSAYETSAVQNVQVQVLFMYQKN